jgi:tyrosyl-tRNA synthetase
VTISNTIALKLITIQFFVSQPDADAERLLKFFTFLPLSSIEETMTEHIKSPEKRVAQHRLAREFVELVHGPEEADNAERQHRFMFSQSNPKLKDILKGRPDVVLSSPLVLDQPFSAVLFRAGLAGSKSVGARLIKKKGAYVLLPSSSDADDEEASFTQIETIGDHLVRDYHILRAVDSARQTLVLRSGKRKICIVEIVSEDEFMKRGLDAPMGKEPRA